MSNRLASIDVMRLTSQATEILRALQAPQPVLRLVGGRVDLSLIDKLRQLGEPLAAPALIPLLLGAQAPTFDRIASVVAAILEPVSPARLPELDDACRSLGQYDLVDWSAWRGLTPNDVRALESSLGREAAPVLGVASFHRSGYVREAAIMSLDRTESGGELPYLIVRLNDWVTPVAEAARAAVVRRIGAPWVAEWVRCLALVSRMKATTRRGHDDVIERAFALLRDERHGDALREGFRSNDRVARRVAYMLARDSTAFSIAQVVELALRDRDPMIRLDAIREAMPRLDDTSFLALLDTIDANPFMPVRRAGLHAAAERFPDRAVARAERALMDRNPAVRELARFQLTQRDAGRSFAVVYRDEIATPNTAARLSTALAGLGETGEPADARVIEPFALHARSSVRRAAVRALARLDPEASGAVFVRALSDSSPRVIHESRDALAANASLIDLDTVRRVVRDAPTLAGRIAALALGQSLGKWRSLALWLEASMSPELELAEHARQLLRMWVIRANRSSVAPPARELVEIDATLARTRFSLDDSIRRELSEMLDVWR